MNFLRNFALFGVFLAAAAAGAQEASKAAPGTSAAWEPGVVNLFATLPVLDEGRVKPLDTYAGIRLLKFNGRRACRTPEGKSLTPITWLLDCLFYPEQARTYKVFRIDNSDLLVALGLPFEKKRDRYSYNDLAAAREKLFALAEKHGHESRSEQTPLDAQIINLAMNVHEFEQLAEYLDFARTAFPLEPAPVTAELFPNATEVRLSDIIHNAPAIARKFMAMRDQAAGAPDKEDPALRQLAELLQKVDTVAGAASGLALFPPPDADREAAWWTVADVVNGSFQALDVDAAAPMAAYAERVARLERMAAARDDAAAFAAEAGAMHEDLVKAAAARGQYGRIGLEVFYYRAQLVYYALMLYVLSFVVVACSWLNLKSRLLARLAPISVLAPTLLLAAAITLRCIIRGRPPVTTLYETILFITATAAAVSLFIEYVNRQRIGVALASVLGMLGLFLAYKYEIREGADTMPNMVAVLDTNFWLATHVTTITIGYAAGLLAGAIAHIYVFAKLFGYRRGDAAFYAGITRMTYGVTCFGLLFSVVGTVLGGIWANESWGRFWGWDPKENGALLIVLWLLAMLHARRGAIIRDFGFNLAAVFGAIVVAFSWFGVNLLGVGLHSYGFTSGTYKALLAFYSLEIIVILIGVTAWLRERKTAG